jgi:hypothetical protein
VPTFSRAWKALPPALALALLAFEAALPWTAAHYLTQDGPSHLYTAMVVKDLILHPHGLYASVYRLQPRLVTNWGTTLLFGALVPVFGPDHAEAAMATLCILIGFGALTYLRRSFDPSLPFCDPLTNFLLNTWFMWVGYYNFYLGMAICTMLAGYSMRHAQALTKRRAGALGLGLVVLFFTHALAAALAVMIVVLVLAYGYARGAELWPTILAAIAPVLILLGFFVKRSWGRTAFRPEIGRAWRSFPMHVFASARGRAAEEALLVPAMTIFLMVGLLALRRREWTSLRLPLAAAAGLSLAGYLLAPDTGFGGDQIKIRLAWAVFLFGCPVAASGARMRMLRGPISIYIACLVAANLIVTAQIMSNVSRAAGLYASAFQGIPAGSAFVRVHYGLQGARERYGFDEIASDPMFHADAWVASRGRWIDLSDYEAPSRAFPITFRKVFSGQQQSLLYRLEIGETAGFEPLKQVLEDLPIRPEYVVLVGDNESEAVRRSDFSKTAAWLESNLMPVSEAGSFVRVYRQR